MLNWLVFTVSVLHLQVVNMAETFQHCLRTVPNPGLVQCAGRQALTSLNNIQEIDNFTITNGFMMIRDENLAARSVPNFLEQDPTDFR